MTETCKKHHLIFEKNAAGDYRASDIWCGKTVNGVIWYCSEECSGIKDEKREKEHKLTLR